MAKNSSFDKSSLTKEFHTLLDVNYYFPWQEDKSRVEWRGTI